MVRPSISSYKLIIPTSKQGGIFNFRQKDPLTTTKTNINVCKCHILHMLIEYG